MNSFGEDDGPAGDAPERAVITTKTGEANPAWEQPVYFPEWRAILELEPFEPPTRARYARAIIRYLAHLKTARERASIAGAKRYLEAAGGASGPARAVDREALRWFFLAHRRVRAGAPSGVAHPVDVRPPTPIPIAPDTPPWEADLVRQIRLRGLLWNTEQIYRGWPRLSPAGKK